MNGIIYKPRVIPEPNCVKELYDAVKWEVYTRNLAVLMRALANSLFVITAWDQEVLVGLIRIVGDGETIIYIQDLLVRPDYQRQGIGKSLIELVCTEFKAVRQKVLLTDSTPLTRGFYQSVGFNSIEQDGLISYVRFD